MVKTKRYSSLAIAVMLTFGLTLSWFFAFQSGAEKVSNEPKNGETAISHNVSSAHPCFDFRGFKTDFITVILVRFMTA
jgi:hypothetical protein